MKLFDEILSAVTDQTAHNMSPGQIAMESGGRQFDKDGKPLVGRYSDGSMPKPSERAYGVAQMQIGTGQRVAAAHGVAWDQTKFLNDSAYNRKLGDLHMDDLRKKYGDEKLALGAYHSGETNVDRAIASHGRENFWQGLGPEGRAYVGHGGSMGNAVGNYRVSSVPKAQDLSTVQPSQGEVAAMSGQPSPGASAFTAGPDIAAAATEQQRRASVGDSVLAAVTAKADAVRAQEKEALTRTVEAKRGLNEHNRQVTEQMIERATPIFQKRQAILDRRVEIGNMNPFVAAIKGAFDPHYNKDYLDGMDAAMTRQLAGMDEAHAEDTKLHQTLANLSQADFNDQDSLFKLQLENLGQDVTNSVLSWQSQSRVLSSEIDKLQAGSSVIAAQQTAKNDTLSGLTDGQLNQAMKMAGDNNGVAVVNGVSLHMPELQQLAHQRQNQLYAIESAQLGIESNRVEFADKAKAQVIDTMTEPEVKTAIANGGRFKGLQLDVTKLGARLQGLQQTTQLVVQGQILQDAAANAKPMMQHLADQTTAQTQRLIGIFGKVPDEYSAFSRTMATTIRTFVSGLQTARTQGVGDQYMAANLPVIQGMIDTQNATIDGVVKRWSGGNTNIEAVGRAWIKGEPLDSGAAMRGLIHMARNGAPAGTQFTGPASQVFAVVQDEVRKEDAPKAGQAVTAFGSSSDPKGTQEQRDNALIQRIQSRVGATYNESVVNGTILRTPQLAKNVPTSSSNAAPHPFSNIDPATWATAVHAGDSQGIATTATKLGLSAADFKTMLTQGPSGAIWKEVSAGKKGDEASFGYWTRILAADQARSTLEILDANVDRSVTGGMRPSQAYANLMHSPQWRQVVSNETRIDKLASFAGFVTSQAGAGNVDGAYGNYADTILRAYNNRAGDSMTRTAQRATNLSGNPVERTRYLLGAIDGLSSQDEVAFLNYIKPMIPAPHSVSVGSGDPLSAPPSGVSLYDPGVSEKIDSFIITGHSDNPEIERIRRHISKQWSQVVQIAGRAHDKYYAGE